MKHAGANAGTRRCLAGDAVAGGHERIGAMVDVEQRALGAFEQEVAGLIGGIERSRNVGHKGTDGDGVSHCAVIDRLEFDRSCLQVLGEDEVVVVRISPSFSAKRSGWKQVIDPQSAPGDLSS